MKLHLWFLLHQISLSTPIIDSIDLDSDSMKKILNVRVGSPTKIKKEFDWGRRAFRESSFVIPRHIIYCILFSSRLFLVLFALFCHQNVWCVVLQYYFNDACTHSKAKLTCLHQISRSNSLLISIAARTPFLSDWPIDLSDKNYFLATGRDTTTIAPI
jgi:uncharacterized integral membrane protein